MTCQRCRAGLQRCSLACLMLLPNFWLVSYGPLALVELELELRESARCRKHVPGRFDLVPFGVTRHS